MKTDLKKDVIYKPRIQNDGFNVFLISKDGRIIIYDGGYNKHFDFFAETIEGDRLIGYEGVDFVYNGEVCLTKCAASEVHRLFWWILKTDCLLKMW
uniref:hypothetical protein n=1 Tax=Agathobacter sp. TaxID=2021311 RepID=UPI0040567967